MARRKQATQKTQPKTDAEPVEIPVPKRKDFFGTLKRAAKGSIVRRTSTKR